jgi:hypothetical protein
MLSARVQALEEAIQKLVQVHSENMTAIKRAFATTDGHLWVLKQIGQDIVNGSVAFTEEYQEWRKKMVNEGEALTDYPGGDIINMDHYYELWNTMQDEKMKQLEELRAKEKEEAGGGPQKKEEEDGESPNEGTEDTGEPEGDPEEHGAEEPAEG